jgi:UDP-N-acetylmuramoyl-L-alanyl-D-glutamate--2,6-diaminopimelate ligase
VKTGLTTPDIVTFLSNMAGLKRMGMTHVAYEASSHGLDQHRAEGVPLAGAAFTNFSRDHLDYHPTMDSYFEAKMRLFDELLPLEAPAVVWTDDPKSEDVIERARRRGHQLLTIGRTGETIRLVEQSPSPLGQTLMLDHGGKSYRLALPLIGAYQASNVLTAAGLVLATGGAWDATYSAMQRVAPVRGRLERAVISRGGVPVYVDYAHTADALEAAIAALRPHVGGRLITVFGAGGDRDQGKRPEMGAVAVERSDIVIVTDDNPRSEDPARIRADILSGAPDATEVPGRREAIAEAIRIARSGDIVLVAGKGHETGQIIGDRVLPFDDALVARECAA